MINLYAIFCILAFIIVVIYVGFFKEKSIWFLMAFISLTICNAGYLMIALSQNIEEALLANRVAYIGSVFLPFFLLIAIMDICKFRYHRITPFILIFISTIILLLTLSSGYFDIYYKTVFFSIENGIGVIKKEYGILHSLYYVYLTGYFGMMLFVIIRSFFKRKDVSYKHAIYLVIAVLINICIYFVEKIINTPFEMLSFSYIITACFLLYINRSLESYNVQLVMKMTLEKDSTGVILFDNYNHFKGCNDDAFEIFPELRDLKLEFEIPNNNELFDKITATLLNTDALFKTTLKRNNRIYKLSAKPFKKNSISGDKKLGTAIIISDDTSQQEYFLLIASYNEKLEAEVIEKTKHILQMHDNLIFGMADMVEGRDPNTGGHIKRTSAIVEVFVKKLEEVKYGNFSSSFYRNVIKAAPMHDLGKITIDDAILRKPGKYTADEFEIMKTHAVKGAEIVGKVLNRFDDEEFFDIAENVAHYHHEKYNGNGYPDKLKAEEIPIEARIMALADVFDALISQRVYKEKYSFEEAFKIIRESLGEHFDPKLGEIFLSCKDELIKNFSNI